MKGPLAGLMQQAQKMQEDMQRMQDELARLEVSGQAGGGLVEICMNGRHEVRKLKIDPVALADPELLEDLLIAAFNDAVNRIAAAHQERVGGLTQGLSLPPGFKLPF